jgi:hypothetical protein
MVKLIMGGNEKIKSIKGNGKRKKTHRKGVFVTPNGLLGDASCK